MAISLDGGSHRLGPPWSRRAALTPRKTYSSNSSIVYKRPARGFRKKDIIRILKRYPIDEDPDQEEERDLGFPWFWDIINWISEYMLRKIFAAFDMNDDAVEIFWSAINLLWEKLLQKIFPGDSYINSLRASFDEKFRTALKRYTRDGDRALLDALYEDVTGG